MCAFCCAACLLVYHSSVWEPSGIHRVIWSSFCVPSVAAHHPTGIGSGCFQLLLFITVFSCAWEHHDNRTGHEPSQVFGSCITAAPVWARDVGCIYYKRILFICLNKHIYKTNQCLKMGRILTEAESFYWAPKLFNNFKWKTLKSSFSSEK